MDSKKLRELDYQHLWHPYTDIDKFEATDFPIVERSEGIHIYDTDGKKYIDGIASWWCVNFGHSHPKLVKAIQEQASKLQNVILGGCSHQNAILLAQKLKEVTPPGLNHSFFASDGASAVEAALRIALQYWENKNVSGRKKFICLQDGYHGDTLGAIGVGYVEHFHRELKDVVGKNFRATSPHCAKCPYSLTPQSCSTECFASMQKLIEEHHREVAAVIVEPLCQGASGIRIYPAAYLQKLRATCSEFNLLLIADEIAVGFARTGAMFACELAETPPDIITIGKGLTGGYLPLSAAVVTSKIYNSFRAGHTFYHGHTYCGNPLATAVALRAVELYREERILERVAANSIIMAEQIKETCKLFGSSFSASLGMIAMIEISETDGGQTRAQKIALRAMELGLFIRPLGATIYLWPPLVIKEDELQKIFELLTQAIRETA